MQNSSLPQRYSAQQVLAESLFQNIPNWRKVVEALPPQGCILVTRLHYQQFRPEIEHMARMLTEQGTQVFVVSVDAPSPAID